MWPLAVLVVMVAGLAGCDDGLSAQEHYVRATTLHRDGDFPGAILALKSALKLNGKFREARELLGETYVRLGDGASAEKEIRLAIDLGADTPDVRVAYLRSLLLQNKNAEVMDELANVRDVSGRATLLNIRGEAQLGLQRTDDAVASFEAALALETDSARSHMGLARVAFAQDDPNQAEEQIQRALALDENDREIWIGAGELAIGRGDYDFAQGHFEKAEALAPYDLTARFGAVRSLLRQDKLEEAQAKVTATLKRNPNHHVALYLAGLTAFQMGDHLDAATKVQGSLATQPLFAPSLFLSSILSIRNGDLETAHSHLRQYVAHYPREPLGRKLLGAVYLRLDQPTDAIETLGPLAASSDDPTVYAQLASAYFADHQYERGLTLVSRAAELSPNSAPIRTQLAMTQLAAGELDDIAIAELEKAYELDPSFVSSSIFLVVTHLRNGDFDAAFDAAKRLTEESPDNPIGWNLMGAASEGKLEPIEAREFYEKALSVDPGYLQPALNLGRMDIQQGEFESARKRYEAIVEQSGFNVEALLNLAAIDISQGQIDVAVDRYKSVLAVEPNNAKALTTLAELAAGAGRRAEGIAYLETARQSNPRSLKSRILLTQIYISQGRYEEALAVAGEANEIAQGAPGTLLLLGRAQRNAGDPYGSIDSLKKSIALNPSVDAYYELAQTTALQGNVAETEVWLRRALELDPNDLPSRTALTALIISSGQYDEAKVSVAALQADYPDFPGGFALGGDLFVAMGEPAKALQAYDQAFARSESADLVYKIYQAHVAVGSEDQALGLLTDWLKEHPDDQDVRLVLATASNATGDEQAAMAAYERVLKAQPDNVTALNNLALLLIERDGARAEELAARAVELVPEAAALKDTYGWVLLSNGTIEKALNFLKKAAQGAPENGTIDYHYAIALSRSGSLDEAKARLQALLESNVDFPEREHAKQMLDVLQ